MLQAFPWSQPSWCSARPAKNCCFADSYLKRHAPFGQRRPRPPCAFRQRRSVCITWHWVQHHMVWRWRRFCLRSRWGSSLHCCAKEQEASCRAGYCTSQPIFLRCFENDADVSSLVLGCRRHRSKCTTNWPLSLPETLPCHRVFFWQRGSDHESAYKGSHVMLRPVPVDRWRAGLGC